MDKGNPFSDECFGKVRVQSEGLVKRGESFRRLAGVGESNAPEEPGFGQGRVEVKSLAEYGDRLFVPGKVEKC